MLYSLNETFHLNLNPNMLFAIASYHDVGKYIDHKRHHLIAVEKFMEDEVYQVFLKDMRSLLSRADDFKKLYCDINHITNRSKNVDSYPGVVDYGKVYQKL